MCKATCNGTNEYWSGVEANGTRLVLAPGGSPPPPAQDDVLMIIQMQGGIINNSDDLNYGAGNGTGSGFTDVGLAGQYEFAEVASVTTGAITLSKPLAFNYSSANNNRFQAIRVALCREATVNNPHVPAWNGSVGGVLVVLADHIRLGDVSLEGKGFRGGPKIIFNTQINDGSLIDTARFRDNSTSTRLNDSSLYNAPKGEGFIGFPRFLDQVPLNTTTYPEGFDCAKGAPGNAGGGSNWRDAGGGGGANGGKGGDGSWIDIEPWVSSPGLGGAPAPSNATNRIFLGKATRLVL